MIAGFYNNLTEIIVPNMLSIVNTNNFDVCRFSISIPLFSSDIRLA